MNRLAASFLQKGALHALGLYRTCASLQFHTTRRYFFLLIKQQGFIAICLWPGRMRKAWSLRAVFSIRAYSQSFAKTIESDLLNTNHNFGIRCWCVLILSTYSTFRWNNTWCYFCVALAAVPVHVEPPYNERYFWAIGSGCPLQYFLIFRCRKC